jgi:cysteine desulfurase
MKLPIYLDNNATTPIDPRVLEAMMPYLTDVFGNAASRTHAFGHAAAAAVDTGREQVAKLIGADVKEIIWTSGATESDNLAIKGAALAYRGKGDHIITQVTEHKAVLDTCKWLERQGFRVTYLPVDRTGRIDREQLEAEVTDKTILVTIMLANNEIGTIQPIEEIGHLCANRGILFHCDATQAVGKVPIDVRKQNIHLLSMSGHKLYGPKGVGVLYVRMKDPRVKLEPIIHGGGHERGFRSGTLNVPGIVGIGKACELSGAEMAEEAPRLTTIREKFWSSLSSRVDEVYRNGHAVHCLPNTINVSFAYVEGESIMLNIPEIAVSSGSACTSATLEPSYVLTACGVTDETAHGSLRFSMGRFTTAEQMEYAADRLVETIQRLREMSPLYEMAKEGVDLSKVQWKSD